MGMRRLLLAGLWVCEVGCLAAMGQETGEMANRLEREWHQIERLPARMSVRGLFGFALEAAAVGWHPERIARVLALAEQAQDRDEESTTFGNFKWYWGAEKPEDRNAVEFCMQKGVLIWMLYKDRLTPEGVERLERLMRFSIEGIRRHRVPESYTNIFLMKAWNCVALGEALGRADVAEEGYQMLERWLLYTWENGIREYLSPTYYGTDLESLGPIARFAKREEGRRAAEAALRLFWCDIAANWFRPCQRLGGAHSRDYDYVTGHGHLDRQLRAEGWIRDSGPSVSSAFLELSKWTMPRELRESITRTVPRVVHQRWGDEPWARATHYVGRRFSIGSAGACYGPMDKTLTVNLAGGPRMPVVNFLMDARGDPYGRLRRTMRSGHRKAHHLTPFLMSVQRGAEVLLLASIDPAWRAFRRYAPEPSCLLSHVVIPANVAVWMGDSAAQLPGTGDRTDVPRGEAVFLRFQDVAVGIRFVLALDGKGRPAPVVLANDGKYGAMRLTCTHSAKEPEGSATVAVWVRAAEGLDEAAFAAFRRGFAGAAVETKVDGDRIEVSVPGAESKLRLAANVETRERLACEGAEPGAEDRLLAVNGRDLGREILGDVGPIARYRRLVAVAEKGAPGAPRAEEIIEAEAAGMMVPPFRVGEHKSASGGKFIWVPGAPGAKGRSRVARAVWAVNVPKAGKYHLWARVLAPTPEDDSFVVRIHQAGRVVLPRSDWHTGLHKEWEWVPVRVGRARRSPSIHLKAGAAVIEFYCREDGTRLDALYLTADPDARPTDLK